MIVNPVPSGLPVGNRATNVFRKLRVIHPSVRAQDDKKVEGSDPEPSSCSRMSTTQVHWHGPSAVGNQHQNPPMGDIQPRQRFGDRTPDLLLRQEA